mgnify:CR=1 FL=1
MIDACVDGFQLGVQPQECGLRRSRLCPGRFEPGLIVGTVQRYQGLPCVHKGIVGDQNMRNIAGDAGGNHCHVSPDIGIIGGFIKPSADPPVNTQCRNTDKNKAASQAEAQQALRSSGADNAIWGSVSVMGNDCTVTVNSVSEPKLPELNEEFFAQFGIKETGIEGFRTEVRKNMERELRQAIKSKVKNQVMDGLLAANPIEVPKALLSNEVDRLRVQAVQQFGGNIKPDQLPAELFEEQAKRRVVLGLIVAEVVKQFDLKPDEDRVREMIQEMASAYQEPEQVVAWYYKNDQQLNEVRSVVLEEQVVDTVLQKAKVTDKAVSYEEAVKPVEAPQAD